MALVERGYCPSREKAKRAVIAGIVRVNGQVARKPSDPVRELDNLFVETAEKFVSRGGLKLEHALSHFKIDPRAQTGIDIGASTGGFTDCLLQHGATRVYAVDVGRGQLAWKLRKDPRVTVMEGVNARFLSPSQFGPAYVPVELVVIDCSFISLHKILSPAASLAAPSGKIIALVKPQFEAGKAEADRGRGIITDPAIHLRVLEQLERFVQTVLELSWKGSTESPILGAAGNKEFLILIEKTR